MRLRHLLAMLLLLCMSDVTAQTDSVIHTLDRVDVVAVRDDTPLLVCETLVFRAGWRHAEEDALARWRVSP